MNGYKDERKFEVLGFSVKINNDGENQHIKAEEVVEYVQREADKIKDNIPNLEHGQLAVLVALKLGQDLLGLDREFRHNVENIQSSASDALRFIEEVTPATPA